MGNIYEVQQRIGNGWENTWSEEDDAGNMQPQTFTDPWDARNEILEHLMDLAMAIRRGDMSYDSFPPKEDFRIVNIETGEVYEDDDDE